MFLYKLTRYSNGIYTPYLSDWPRYWPIGPWLHMRSWPAMAFRSKLDAMAFHSCHRQFYTCLWQVEASDYKWTDIVPRLIDDYTRPRAQVRSAWDWLRLKGRGSPAPQGTYLITRFRFVGQPEQL